VLERCDGISVARDYHVKLESNQFRHVAEISKPLPESIAGGSPRIRSEMADPRNSLWLLRIRNYSNSNRHHDYQD
jgi:hypothetical protein